MNNYGNVSTIGIGEDKTMTINIKEKRRDVNGDLELDADGNVIYDPVDITTFDKILVYLTVESTGKLIGKFSDPQGSVEPIDMTDAGSGRIKINVLRSMTAQLSAGDAVQIEVAGNIPATGFTDDQRIALTKQMAFVAIEFNTKLQADAI